MPEPFLTFYEAFPSRQSEISENSTVELRYHLTGTRDDLFAKAFAQVGTPSVYDGLYRQKIACEETAPGCWDIAVTYGKKANEADTYKWSFDTTGGTQHITQSLETIHNYAPAGKTPPDHKGAIGVTDDEVQGCDIIVPAFKWQETWNLPAERVPWDYAATVETLTGTVNAATFRGRAAKSVLFEGAQASGEEKTPGIIAVTYHFRTGRKVTNRTIGDIGGIDKDPWEYLWVRYTHNADAATRMVQKPASVHVERVYDTGDFSLLGIG